MTTPAASPSPPRRPLLFLDVDGPLIPFGRPEGYPTYPGGDTTNPLLARLNPAYGPRFTALARDCDLVWATTWMHDANECVAPRLGLPELPVLPCPEERAEDEAERNGLHWKTPALVAYAAGRPFAWLDDEISDPDRAWITAHTRAPVLFHRVDPREGLTEADLGVVEGWVRSTIA
ncbi:hypothetical protein CG740_37000 [Streptomyces sp. CB01201]|uniref:HAD domain-containing protein n=1 Tax=unclassified Streptomyces TaxID=2593676 RepID=UPI000C2743B7|nr:HAD domain-containing protein [Streptomyces sp. CB01201]PJM98086.1 hypothetical protein CG740_37000 [Streptomyces sp. CB01201]